MTRSEVRALREKFAGGRPLSSRETFALFDTLDLILAEIALQKTELQIISAAITERDALRDEVRNLRASLEVADHQWTQAQRELDAECKARVAAERGLAGVIDLLREAQNFFKLFVTDARTKKGLSVWRKAVTRILRREG